MQTEEWITTAVLEISDDKGEKSTVSAASEVIASLGVSFNELEDFLLMHESLAWTVVS